MQKLTVLGASLSPFVRKVLVALVEKGIEFDIDPVIPFNPPANWREISPFGKIPVLRVTAAGGTEHIADSSAILAYLDAAYPAKPLFPGDPLRRGKAVWFEEVADSELVKAVGAVMQARVLPKVIGSEPKEELAIEAITQILPPIMNYLESSLQGAFLVGENFSIADIAITSMFANLQHGGVAPDATRWPKLAAYVARQLARPSFADLIAAERKTYL